MPNRQFLEQYPLYRKFTVTVPATLDKVPTPAVHMYCQICQSDQTFNMSNAYFDTSPYMNYPSGGQVVRAEYLCTSCQRFHRYFILKFDPNYKYIVKVGQEPPWEITMDRALENTLGERAHYYKKGLVCESQGYGIGAFGYYRRIVEEIIDDLLAGIPDLMSGEEREQYLEALKETQKTIVAQDKINLVKDLLPPILRPNGMNPLSTLHGTLSQGLHSDSDEQCMELAMEVRETLVFLVNQIEVTKVSSARFTDSMRKLLDRRNR